MAAAITATMVQKEIIASDLISGTAERRLARIYIEGPKATQADYFELDEYLSTAECNNIVDMYCMVKDSSSAYTLDTFTYDGDDYNLDLAGSEVGTGTAIVTYWTE